MPKTVKMALSECCQTITNMADSRNNISFDKDHFIERICSLPNKMLHSFKPDTF